MSKTYAYARISTSVQKQDRQLAGLMEYARKGKISYEKTFQDVVTGKIFDRPEYQKLKQIVCPGDTIVVKEVDRLGRNYYDMIHELEYFRKIKVKVIILDLPILNTGDEILDDILNSVVLKVLAYMAEKEMERIKTKSKEGFEAAIKRGVKIGRPEVKLSKSFYKYYDEWKAGKLKAVEVARLLEVTRQTFYKYVKIHEGRYKKVG